MAHWEKCEAIDLQVGDITPYGKVVLTPIQAEDEQVRIEFEDDDSGVRIVRKFYAYREIKFQVD